MTKIDLLLEKLCPKGVPFLALGEVAYIQTGQAFDKTNLGGNFPVWNGGVTSNQFVFESNTPGNTITIPARGSVGIVGYQLEDFWCGPLCYRIRFLDAENSNRFLYFFLKSIEPSIQALQQSGSIPALNKKELESLRIPLPPIQVQNEIVAILDKFTQFNVELEAELKAELEARKKQYVYYNKTILRIDESDAKQNILSVKEICKEKFWLMPATPKYEVDGSIPYVTSKNLSDGTIDFSSSKMISKESFEKISKNRKIEENDVLIGMIGTIGEVARVKGDDLPFYGQNMYLLRLNQEVIDIDFFLQILNSSTTRKYFSSIKHNSSQGYLKAEHVEELRFPVPVLTEQRQIAKILDNLKSTTIDISKDLPAELKARRQQYEYYRNKLLTFREVDVA